MTQNCAAKEAPGAGRRPAALPAAASARSSARRIFRNIAFTCRLSSASLRLSSFARRGLLGRALMLPACDAPPALAEPRRVFRAHWRRGQRAARVETAALGKLSGRGGLPGCRSAPCAPCCTGQAAQQAWPVGWRGAAKNSSTGASSTIRPAYITSTRSQSCATTPRSCVINRIAIPGGRADRATRAGFAPALSRPAPSSARRRSAGAAHRPAPSPVARAGAALRKAGADTAAPVARAAGCRVAASSSTQRRERRPAA